MCQYWCHDKPELNGNGTNISHLWLGICINYCMFREHPSEHNRTWPQSSRIRLIQAQFWAIKACLQVHGWFMTLCLWITQTGMLYMVWLLTPVSLQQIYTSQAWSSRCSEVVLILTCDLALKIIAHFYLNSKYILLNFASSPLFFKHPCMTNHHHDHPSWVPTFIMITITFIIICISYWKAAMDQESFATLWHPRNQIVYFGQYPNYSLLGL